jgi:hypothetical protein
MKTLPTRSLVVVGPVVLAGVLAAGVSVGTTAITVPDVHGHGLPTLARAADAAQGRAGGAAQFVCNQVTAMTLTREWYEAGFEQQPGIADERWQLKARQSGYITEWSNPNSNFWNQTPQSPCANGSASPDHVVLTVLSWRPACCSTQAEWEAQVTTAVNTLRSKYAGLKRIDLMTVVRGPGNKGCPAPPVAGEYIAMPAELDGGLAAVAAKFPGLVFVGPKVEAPTCASLQGGGPHLTPEGNAAVAKAIAAHFVNLQ